MYKDPTNFRDRFNRYKNGNMPYENGLPKYENGATGLNFIDAFVLKMGPSLYAALQRHGVKNANYAFANMMRQLALESDYGRSRVAREQNNFGGVGFNGKTYTTYKDVDEFVDKYVKLMNGRYAKALGVYDPALYAKIVHGLGYFTGSLDDYVYNMTHMKSLNHALASHVKNNPNIYPAEGFINGVPSRIYRPEDRWKKLPNFTDTPEYNPPIKEIPKVTLPDYLTIPRAPETISNWRSPDSPSEKVHMPDLKQEMDRYNALMDIFGWNNDSKKKFGLPPLKSLPPSLDEILLDQTKDYFRNVLLVPLLLPPSLFGYKNGKLPKFEGGLVGGYVRSNGNPVKFDDGPNSNGTGELIDLVTGERGTMLLPEVTIKPKHYDAYNSAYNPEDVVRGFNILTLGGLNNLSPAQWLRRGYDAINGNLTIDSWLNGNAGIVPNSYAKEYPLMAAAANGLVDFWTLAGPNLLKGAFSVGTKLNPLKSNLATTSENPYKYSTESNKNLFDTMKRMLIREALSQTGRHSSNSIDVAKDPYYIRSLGRDVVHHEGMPNEVEDIFRYQILPRTNISPMNYNNAMETLKRYGYNTLDDYNWKKYVDEDWLGYLDNNTQGIAIRNGYVRLAAPHEFRHRMQRLIPDKPSLSIDRKAYLDRAYDDDFVNLPNTVDKTDHLYGYKNMVDEKATTNLDARSYAFENFSDNPDIGKMSIAEQNKFLDSLSDDQIISAVAKSNGYGRRFVDFLEQKYDLLNNPILNALWANKFRNAMKYYGSAAIPTTIAYGAFDYKDDKLPRFSNGKIHINPANRGKFNATKKRTGKTTEELTHSSNPLTRKRAIFALNAKKWHHK